MKKILMILVITMLAALPVSGQIPRLINYQGVLTDDMGVVVADGSYNMTFRLYDVPSGGSHLWEEAIAVNVSKGIFNTTLGHDIPIDEDFDKPLYLALEINGGGELSPRRIFTANAYAFSARALYGVNNVFPSDGYVGIGTTAPEAPLHLYTNISSSIEPSLLIQNVGSQSVIEFKQATVTEARIRKAAGGDLFIGNVTGNGISFTLLDTAIHKMDQDGNFGIGTVTPVERLDVNGAIRLGTTANTNEGTIRWTGADFEGYDGSLWNSLTTGGGSGLPSGSSTNTLRHNGADWVAATNLSNDGTSIGIGTASPSYPLHIVNNSGQYGLRVDGNDADYSMMLINAVSATAKPGYAYMSQGGVRAYHTIDAGYNWSLWMQGASGTAMMVSPGGWTAFGGAALAEAMNLPGAIRLNNAVGNYAGTIQWTGSDFEGYNGSNWNSLTAGALPSGTANQTLRYDGADWVTSANLTNTGSEIGIGTATPGAELHVYGTTPVAKVESNTPTGETTLEFKTSNGTYDYLRLVKYGPSRIGAVAGGIPVAGLSQINTGSDAGALMLQTEAAEPLYFVTGNLPRMTINGDGDFVTYSAFSGSVMSIVYGGASGYYFGMYDNLGNLSGSLESDTDTGGFMSLKRNASQDGFLVNGNYLGLAGTRVDILGVTTAIALDASAEGDDSVELPPDAISAPEILDEPGAAYDWRSAVYNLDGGITSVAVRTITVPAAGYVIVWGTAEVQIDHTSGTADHGRLGVSADEISYPAAQNNDLKLDSGLATGVYNFPVTVHGLFEVAGAGEYTYYLIGSEFSGVVSVNKSSLTALYIPTAYGPVDALSASYGSAPSDSDPALERREAEEFNSARVERELAAMRDRIAALESELGNK